MFFGAGNLIFPLIVGRYAGVETPYALLGLGISAVAFPFLGLVAMMLFNGHIQTFLGRVGKWPAFALLFILQMSQGPVGAMPRLVTLMHASLKEYLPIPLVLFSVGICVVIFLLTVRPQKIIQLLGVVLTPLLLLSLAILVGVGSFSAPEAHQVAESSSHYFVYGLKMGYQTTDLLAALLFATIVLPHVSQGTTDRRLIWKRMTYASLIASALLMATYVGLCWISSHHAGAFVQTAPEDLLQQMAIRILGPMGGCVASAAVLLACLTTAISLAVVFSNYLRQDLLQSTKGNGLALAATLFLTALVANLGFSGIVRMWGPLLDLLYPALILLCLVNIASYFQSRRSIQLTTGK